MSTQNKPNCRPFSRYTLLLLLALSFLLPGQSIHAQDVPIVYEHFNTEMTLQEDGVLHVKIIQQIRFDDAFSGAFYTVPVKNVTSIANVQLYGAATDEANYELDTADLVPIAPNTIQNDGDEIVIDWSYPETDPGDVRLFVIEYDAYGAVWVYPDSDFVDWSGVNADRSGITVDESEVKLTLPHIIPMEQVTTTTNLADAELSIAGQTITYIAAEPLPDGLPFQVAAYFPHGLISAGVSEWQREYDGDHVRAGVEAFQSDLTINADGTLSLQEVTRIHVIEGALHQGTRSLPLLYMDEVNEPNVAINGQPLVQGSGECTGCYLIYEYPRSDYWVYLDPETEQLAINEENGGAYNIDWYTPAPVQAGETVTTTIGYQVAGTLRVNDENQLLIWQVVPDFEGPARQASFRLTLPPGISQDQIVMEGPNEQGTPQLQPDGTLLYRFDGPVAPGTWQIALTLPADATSAEAPIWQQQFEEVLAQADAAAVANARNALFIRVAGILAVVGALIAAIYAWLRWGRRKVKETLGGYVSEPPSQQSPAMVSYLVDRKASERGVLGSIFFFATLGLLEVDLEGEIKLRRLHNEPLQGTARLPDLYGESVTLSRHLQLLFDQVLLPALPLDQWAPLDSIAPRLQSTLPEIYAALGGDIQKFFIRVPGSNSDTIPGSLWFVTYATILGLLFFEVIPWYWGFIIGFVVLIAFVAWSALHETGQGGYSDEGALEADRWRRFKTYLTEIKKYGDLGAAQEIIDRYFGYAVALGVEELFLARAAELGTLEPIWMADSDSTAQRTQSERRRPTPVRRRPIFWPRPSTSPPTAPHSDVERPTLAGMSAQLGDSIRRASSDLGSLLGTAAGDANQATRTVVINSQLRRREMEWKPNTPVNNVLDDILRQAVSDARAIQAREISRRSAERSRSSSGGGWDWSSGGGSSSSSSSRSSSSFGSSSSRSSSSSRPSSSSSSSSRSGGSGRSGFR